MIQEAIFLPVIALAALTVTVLGLVPIRRFAAALARKVTAADFAYGESANVPGEVSLPNRNYMNLLELPVLFYVVCLSLYATRQVDNLVLQLAWAYVGVRLLHSLVHLTFNKVMIRLALFAASIAVLVSMWALFALRIAAAVV